MTICSDTMNTAEEAGRDQLLTDWWLDSNSSGVEEHYMNAYVAQCLNEQLFARWSELLFHSPRGRKFN